MCWSTPRSRFAIAEDQEQVDKLLSIADRLPELAHIVYDEPRGLRDYDHAHLQRIDGVQTRGREKLAAIRRAGCVASASRAGQGLATSR